jgi:hypothetical protein
VSRRAVAIGLGPFQEGVGTLLELDALLTHAVGQPMVLIEADAGGEWKVRADALRSPEWSSRSLLLLPLWHVGNALALYKRSVMSTAVSGNLPLMPSRQPPWRSRPRIPSAA